MAWYNNLGDLTGDIKSLVTGHNPSNNAPPSPIPAGGPMSIPMAPGPVSSGQGGFASTQPVYPGLPTGDAGGGDQSILSKIPGWVLDGLKTGVPAALDWIKNNSGTLIQGATVADAVYRQMQADKYSKQALQLATDSYNARAPLRDQGIQGMLNAGKANPFSVAHQGLPLAPPGAAPSSYPAPINAGRLSRPVNQAAGIPFAGRLTPLLPRS